MTDFFTYGDQPTTCPHCGVRTVQTGWRPGDDGPIYTEQCPTHGDLEFVNDEDETYYPKVFIVAVYMVDKQWGGAEEGGLVVRGGRAGARHAPV